MGTIADKELNDILEVIDGALLASLLHSKSNKAFSDLVAIAERYNLKCLNFLKVSLSKTENIENE